MTREAEKLGNQSLAQNVVITGCTFDGSKGCNDKVTELIDYFNSNKALTKREYFAGLAMQGLLTCYDSRIVNFAVKYADALLEELSKPENE